MSYLLNLSISQVQAGLKKGDWSAVEITKVYLDRIAKLDNKIKAYLQVTDKLALIQAKTIDKKIAAGETLGGLYGIPVSIKDVLMTKDIVTTAASKMLQNYLPPYNATAVDRLLAADAIILGKTNCDEFAMGASGENSAYQVTCNPWDLKHIPGGSSSGAAAAVAARECMVSLASDTAGSIRQPASFCGLVGIKPTYGRVSRYGLIAMASSFDTVGPLATTVRDAAQVLQVIAGSDAHDATSQQQAVPDYIKLLKQEPKKLRLGMAREFFTEGLDNKVEIAVKQAIKIIQDLGHQIVEVSLPNMSLAVATYYIITPAEVSANLARYDGLRYGQTVSSPNLFTLYTKTRGQLLGGEVKRRIILGTYVLSAGYYDAYYRQAILARQAIKNDFKKVFQQVDAVIGPTTPSTAFRLGEKTTDPLAMYLADVNTVPASIAGLPAISVPCGLADHLPVGLQFIGPAWSENLLLQMAYVYEQARGEFSLPDF